LKNENITIINKTDSDKRGFKRKTIIQNIKYKVKGWLDSITDEVLRKEIQGDYILTGGALASMLMGDLPNDYDIYMQTPEIATKLVGYYIGKLNKSDKVSQIEARLETPNGYPKITIVIKSSGVATSGNDDQAGYEYFEMTNGDNIEAFLDKDALKSKDRFAPVMITSNAISLNNDVQIITRFIGPAAEIHKNYDFVHVTNYYTEKDGLVLNQEALESIMCKELRYVGSLYPICTMFRIKKFVKRGWTITAGEMLKIAWDINKLNLNDMNVFYDQLTGVDAAYFNQIIGILKKDSQEKIERTYLFELINRIFDKEDQNDNASND